MVVRQQKLLERSGRPAIGEIVQPGVDQGDRLVKLHYAAAWLAAILRRAPRSGAGRALAAPCRNALCAAGSLLVPVQCEYYALEGLSDLMNTVRIVRRSLNPKLELEGVLLTMFDGRTNLAMQVAEEVKHYFPGKVYATVIPRNVRLSEAPSHGKPITAYDRTSRGAEAYQAVAVEFLKKQ